MRLRQLGEHVENHLLDRLTVTWDQAAEVVKSEEGAGMIRSSRPLLASAREAIAYRSISYTASQPIMLRFYLELDAGCAKFSRSPGGRETSLFGAWAAPRPRPHFSSDSALIWSDETSRGCFFPWFISRRRNNDGSADSIATRLDIFGLRTGHCTIISVGACQLH